MKLIHLKLKRECVLVELAEGAKNIRISDWGNFVYDNPIKGEFWVDTLVPLAYREFIGHFPSLTNQDFGSLVEYYHISENMDLTSNFAYKDYKDGIEEQDNVDYDYWDEYAFDTARESFLSAVEAEGWHVNGNPYQNDWDELCKYGHGGFAKEGKSEYEIYTEAQEKVIGLSRCYLFIKK